MGLGPYLSTVTANILTQAWTYFKHFLRILLKIGAKNRKAKAAIQ